ncbi:TetR/AcrR family transcriptional regulator [Streptosporangium sp. NPDC050855]|uniref:TetR/AcrR family transcriptional regulator n=1 Tax=Streptosporangium sp. NPDC050855 TaxID=3366194 RepID=UPI00378C2D78
MPKIVDHDQRREELVRAVWRVISSEGIEGATVRRVAEAAGVSPGGLRHYFDNQSGLLVFAAQAIGRSLASRIAGHLRADLPGTRRARLMLEELLPLDENRRVEVDVWLACLVRSRVDESLAGLRASGWEGERHVCRLAVASCAGTPFPEEIGRRLGDLELERRAARLHVFMDGLTLQTATYPHLFTARDVRTILAEELRPLSEAPTR